MARTVCQFHHRGHGLNVVPLVKFIVNRHSLLPLERNVASARVASPSNSNVLPTSGTAGG